VRFLRYAGLRGQKLGMKSFALEFFSSSSLHRSAFRESSRFIASVSIRQPQVSSLKGRSRWDFSSAESSLADGN
jgi:hypothetical protein